MNFEELSLLTKKNVVAVGMGYKVSKGDRTKKPAIVASVRKKESVENLSPDDLIPERVGGLRTDVIATGTIRPQVQHRYRPVTLGTSVGNFDITAGTLGTIVWKDGKRMILSNNHVLADSNECELGEPIYQPGPHDGGTAEDTVAHLSEYIPLKFMTSESECPKAKAFVKYFNRTLLRNRATQLKAVASQQIENFVDAALAEIDDNIEHRMNYIGLHSGKLFPPNTGDIRLPEMNGPVMKFGRTTALTKGYISQLDVAVNVQYGPGNYALFTNQIMIESENENPFSQGGDSGSLVMEQNTFNPVGLLFAGSDSVTLANPISDVQDALGFIWL
jgi:hypothetical protein